MNFKHSGNAGDIFYALPTIISMSKKHDGGKPANLYLECGVRADYDKRRNHPLGNVRLDESFALSIAALLRTQDYLAEVDIYQDQEIDVDLDLMRATAIDYGRGHIPRWYFYAFDAWYDLGQPWLLALAKTDYLFRVVVNRTTGYRNPRIDYGFLNEYSPIFLGLPNEFEDFRKDVPTAEYVPTKDYLQAARIIKAAKLFVGNQSSLFGLAEAMKVPRVLEVCLYAPNVIPHGWGGRDAVNQPGFQHNVKSLITEL